MINDLPKDDAAAPAAGQDDVLKAAEQHLESKLTPPVRQDYNKIVVAGLKVAMQNGPNGIAASIKNSKNPIPDIVNGAINIVGLLGRQSRGTMPIKAAVPACMTLIIQGLDFARQAKVIAGDQADLTQATRLFSARLTSLFGISTAMLGTAARNLEAMTKDPVNMEKLKRASGLVKDPRASSPTDLPQEPAPDDEEAAV